MDDIPSLKWVLFVCTGNACRSQMAEALLRHLGRGRFEACSAGSHPAGFIHPIAEEAMKEMGVSIVGQYSKSWNEFADKEMDAVITLCENAAATPCPNWPGNAIRAYWPLPDPSFHDGDHTEQLRFALCVAKRIEQKIEGMLEIDFDAESPETIKAKLAALAEL